MSTSAEIVPNPAPASTPQVRHRQNQGQHGRQDPCPSPTPGGGDGVDVGDRDGGRGDAHGHAHGHGDAPTREAKPSPNKTFGRTRDRTVFLVPTTHDMVSELLDPRQPKNASDMAVVAILALHVLVAYLLPASLKRPTFALIYLFWRASYNVGIGYLLTAQSKHRLIVTWARKSKVFEDPAKGSNPRPWLYRLLRRELEAKMDPAEYRFHDAPLEYNTWLVFRRLVDLILMCDFVSYCLFAIVCSRTPAGEMLVMTVARWLVGIILVGFNLWVKLDAHRVVKDYAWYWGDFFYLIDAELTFDGVFEMAPHPMYSIGYAGYYGISMMAASYDVLFISILAHAAQFAFLVLVENPHIEKTYNPPPPRMRATDSALPSEASHPDPPGNTGLAAAAAAAQQGPRESPLPVHNMLGVKNLDLFRTTDYSLTLLLAYLVALTAFVPNTPPWQAVFVGHALLWRLWFSVGLGVILNGQSREKTFTRHFLKYGESPDEAWRQWKGMYHLSLTMCHASFVAACWKMYNLPDDWASGWVLLKHVVGIGLITLHLWTAMSIYDSLGEFGWFFGDFFFDSTGKLTYKSIYRFLNNPERVLGTAGLWGAALITWSRAIFVLALSGHLLTLGFISYVEKPHMHKIYGRGLRKEAGLTKFIKRSLPPPVKGWQVSVDKVLDETRHFVDEFLEAARTRLAAGSLTIVKDTSALFNKYPARLTLSRIAPDLTGYDAKHYSLSVDGTALAAAASDNDTGKESASARVLPKSVKTKVFEYGAPIKVKWTAPADHSKRDWIGLYMVADNRWRDVSEVSSLGHWVPTCPGVYDTMTDNDKGILSSDQPAVSLLSLVSEVDASLELVQGEVVFEGDRLWWTQGTFEFRYHHDSSHSVISVSEPFEVRIGRFEEYPAIAAMGRGGGTCEDAQDRETATPSSPTRSPEPSHPAPTLTINTKMAEVAAAAAALVPGSRSSSSSSSSGSDSGSNSGTLSEAAVAAALLPTVQNCLDRDPDIAPATVDERFGGHVERDVKYARRVVYAIHHMFGVEFAPEVVPADGNVRRLAWRVCHAKQVLAPYSMSHGGGEMTPVEEEFPQCVKYT